MRIADQRGPVTARRPRRVAVAVLAEEHHGPDREEREEQGPPELHQGAEAGVAEHLADARRVAQGRPDTGAEHARALDDQQVALGEHRAHREHPEAHPEGVAAPRQDRLALAVGRAADRRPQRRPPDDPPERDQPEEPAEADQLEEARAGAPGARLGGSVVGAPEVGLAQLAGADAEDEHVAGHVAVGADDRVAHRVGALLEPGAQGDLEDPGVAGLPRGAARRARPGGVDDVGAVRAQQLDRLENVIVTAEGARRAGSGAGVRGDLRVGARGRGPRQRDRQGGEEERARRIPRMLSPAALRRNREGGTRW